MELRPHSTLFFGEGWVQHTRPPSTPTGFLGRFFKLSKLSNSFRYPIFNLLIPIHVDGALKALEKSRFLSVSSKDYLNSQEGDIKERFEQFLESELGYSCDQVWLQTLPRMFGYAFNPVSFWYCYKNEKLDAVLCEVNNTFGDRHFYFIDNLAENSTAIRKALKGFHVSPFMDISGYYAFEFNQAEHANQVRIRLYEDSGILKLDTRIGLDFQNFDQVSSWSILKKYGWLTILVIWRIHFQALKLWIKGALFFKRPTPPKKKVTYGFAKSEQ